MGSAADIAAGYQFLLQPGEMLRANLRFTPKKLPRKAQLSEDEAQEHKPLWKVREEQEAADLLVQDSEQTGNLVIQFSNGTTQLLTLVASCVFPAVAPHPASLDFGTLLVGRPVQRTVQIRNLSQANLAWSLVRAEDANFKVDRKEGRIAPLVATALEGQEGQAVVVTFTPDREGTYDKVVQVQAENGRSAVLRLRAVGSFDEVNERRQGHTGYAAPGAGTVA